MEIPVQTRQFTTFYLGDRLCGIDVMQVQEVTKALPLTVIRLAPPYIKGLINLRGQIATAIGLRELFGMPKEEGMEQMTVVCRGEGSLLSFLVDRIGDVVEVSQNSFEVPPDTLQGAVRNLVSGVYKVEGDILSVIGIEQILEQLNKE